MPDQWERREPPSPGARGTRGSLGDDVPFATERQRLGDALDDTQAHLSVLVQHAIASMDEGKRDEIRMTALHTTEFLHSLVEVTIGWLLLRQAEVAHARLDGDATGAAAEFYTGKVASTRWFARTVRPKAALRRRLAEGEDGWVTELPETAV